MRKFLIITALAGVTLAVAGCGPDSSNSASSGPGGGGGGGGGKSASCDLAPSSLIKSQLGLDVGKPSATDDGGSVLVCTYPPPPGASKTVIVRFDTDSTAAQFKTTRDGYAPQNMQTTDFPGFGDEAYTNTISVSNLGITTNTLVTRKGKVELLVSSSASFEQEKSLEQKLFDALA
jgi:hypothetical protein